MSDFDDQFYYKLRKEGKIYISKAFKFNENTEEVRNVKIVFENCHSFALGEINGTLSIRKTPTGKQQVLAVVTQDDKQIKSVTFEKFREDKNGEFIGTEKEKFSFRGNEFTRLLDFLKSIKFIDLSNRERHQIEDISSNTGNKTIIDSTETALIKLLQDLKGEDRINVLEKIKANLTKEDLQILLGRKEALETFQKHLKNSDWIETQWQSFFEKENWIFGYGLDYRIMRIFDRELNVSNSGTDNQDKAIVDFLMTFTDFTATVEIKRPDAQIFDKKGRSGIWKFNSDFTEAISQVLEQKAEWQLLSQQSDLYNKSGKKLLKRTRDAKAILIIGDKKEFSLSNNQRESDIKMDTFELFRRGQRNVEILTYDELLDRAQFIVNHNTAI